VGILPDAISREIVDRFNPRDFAYADAVISFDFFSIRSSCCILRKLHEL
jgi:hypothetical protein